MNIKKMMIKGYPKQLRVNFNYLIPHNTAGNASARQEALRLQSSSQYNNGNAHYWVDENDIYLIIDPKYISWNAGVWEVNTKSISIELCKSRGNLENFKLIEKRAIELMAYLLKQNNSGVDKIFLHSDFYATACPHRSQSIHGKGAKTRNYFRQEVSKLLKNNTNQKGVETVNYSSISKIQGIGVVKGWHNKKGKSVANIYSGAYHKDKKGKVVSYKPLSYIEDNKQVNIEFLREGCDAKGNKANWYRVLTREGKQLGYMIETELKEIYHFDYKKVK